MSSYTVQFEIVLLHAWLKKLTALYIQENVISL